MPLPTAALALRFWQLRTRAERLESPGVPQVGGHDPGQRFAARAGGSVGEEPGAVLVEWLTEMLTMRPLPTASIRGVTSRATRK